MTLDEEKQDKIQRVFDKLSRRRARLGVPLTKGQFAWVRLATRIVCTVALFVVLRWLANISLLALKASPYDSYHLSIIAASFITIAAIGTNEIPWLMDRVSRWVIPGRSIELEEKHARKVAEWSRSDSRVVDICAAWMLQNKAFKLAWHDYDALRKAQEKITQIKDRYTTMLKQEAQEAQEAEASGRIDALLDEAGITRKAHAMAQNQILDQKTKPASGRAKSART